ncbi:transcriptional regulator [Spirosoma aureum]|uniref:Transcriptional regulator n=1 Tax=Spirosoma aureum TaxID=2692134 RepID=A0A6G9AVR2_9BACT|nr:transcriptional regulator [Spirosoma aureum]QIP16490.1 transcriptional regulator [Spirosoma aureum]
MEALRYKIIKSEKQYNDYSTALEELVTGSDQGENTQDEIELLTYLIEKWDAEHNSFEDVDPIELLTALMSEKSLKAKDMTQILGVSKSLVSDILHYKKGLSKEIIRTLSSYFSVSQEAFNRPYKLRVPENSHFKNASVMNTRKDLQLA